MTNKNIARYRRVVTKINKLERRVEGLKERDFAAKTALFKLRVKKGESLDKILPESFALVREAARRVLGLRAYNVQLQGAMAVHEGKIVEMKTGEGKTLTIAFAAYLNCLEGLGVHVVTANDYLAKRDAVWMMEVYKLLGVSAGWITSKTNQFDRQVSYASDITYITNNEVGFDYLKDNMLYDKRNARQRSFHFAIVDEADSVLIDEAQIPLVISENKKEETEEAIYLRLSPVIGQLKKGVDFKVDEKERVVNLTIAGIKKLEKLVGVENLYGNNDLDYIYYISRLLKAHHLFHKDKDYVVEDDEVVIVDEFTGRLMHHHRYYLGIHQAIEAKENVPIGKESRILASITYQHLFKKYSKMAGLTGTAQTAEKEFRLIYGKEVIAISTNKRVIRQDQNDLFFTNWESKVNYLAWTTQEYFFKKRATLIGTRSVKKSGEISQVLLEENIANQVLSAKHNAREAEVIAGAGQPQTVTVATNMAGRGTDIQLHEQVRDSGGLVVLGSERHNTRRIDNQLIGRSGRQGDPGESRFLVSADDEIIKNYYAEEFQAEMLRFDKEEKKKGVWNRKLSSIVIRAQKRMENVFFDQRVLSFEFDRILNGQRESFYRQRNRVLSDPDLKKETIGLIRNEIEKSIIAPWNDRKELVDDFQLDKMTSKLQKVMISQWFKLPIEIHSGQRRSINEIRKIFQSGVEKLYFDLENYFGNLGMRRIEKISTLKVMDLLWLNHLQKVDILQESSLIDSISSIDFFEKYEIEMARAYQNLMLSIPSAIVQTLFRTVDRLMKKETASRRR